MADHGCFLVFFLTTKNQMTGCETLFFRTVVSSVVYPGEVIKSAILHNAASLITAHNYPRGDITPSLSDDEITQQLMAASLPAGIKLLDHVIIGRTQYYSFTDSCSIGDMEEATRELFNQCGNSALSIKSQVKALDCLKEGLRSD